MGGAGEILDELEAHVRDSTRALQEALSGSAYLWDLDPLFTVTAICLEKYGRMFCGSTTHLDLEPAAYQSFIAALKEAEKIGLEIQTVEGPRFHFKWEPFEVVRKTAVRLARKLAGGLKDPVIVEVNILGVSNVRGHLGFSVGIGTCTPARWSVNALVVRYTRLLSLLVREGIGFTADASGYCECTSPLNIFRSEIRCAQARVLSYELEPPKPKPVERSESVSTYIVLVDEDFDKYYPADLEGEASFNLHVILPHFEPPWPSPETARKVLGRLGGQVILQYSNRERGGVIARVKGSLLQLEWGPKLGDCQLKLLEGSREHLLATAKELARAWAMEELGLEEGDPYLKAVKEAESLNELMESALEKEDED
ncbi:MAG: hypothetical protein F7C35_00035 [Desulfurococcales archaeon]|nr:hypothetical protein [Desulfurococcales archaeon]